MKQPQGLTDEEFEKLMNPGPKPASAYETEKEKKLRLQREKMARQFEAFPYLVFILIAQLLSMFVHSVVFSNNFDKFSRVEKVIAFFLLGVFFLFYVNGIFKLVRSFYQII